MQPLHKELEMPKPFRNERHESLLSIVMTGAILTKEAEKVLQPFGITDVQFNVLMLLKDQSDSGRLTQTQIARMLLVNRSNITGVADRMEKKGFVKRIADSADRRINFIEMTDHGREVLMKAHDVYYGRLTEIMKGIDIETCRLLREQLGLIRANTR